MKKIIIKIGSDNQITIETTGFEGNSCEEIHSLVRDYFKGEQIEEKMNVNIVNISYERKSIKIEGVKNETIQL